MRLGQDGDHGFCIKRWVKLESTIRRRHRVWMVWKSCLGSWVFLGLYGVLFPNTNVSRPSSYAKSTNSASSAHMSQLMCEHTVHICRAALVMTFSPVMNSTFWMFMYSVFVGLPDVLFPNMYVSSPSSFSNYPNSPYSVHIVHKHTIHV